MKIGYLVPSFPGQTHGFFWREIKWLEKLHTEIQIISTTRPTDRANHAFLSEAQSRCIYLAEFRARDIIAWTIAFIFAVKIIARRDVRAVIKCNNENKFKMYGLAIIGFITKNMSRKFGIKHIHGHSCADVGYILAFSKIVGGPSYSLSLHGDLEVYGRGHDFKFQNAKFIACVTKVLCEQVKVSIPNLETPVHLIRMGIESNNTHVRKTNNSEIVGRLRLVTVARLNKMKGHSHLIAAVSELVRLGYDIKYDIIGEGDYEKEIAQSILDYKLNDHVKILGPVDNDQIFKILSAYDVFVLPSVGLGEAAPVAVMEAMGAGIPVVCSIIGGTPEMIEDGKTGFLFNQGDESKLTSILKQLADSPELRVKIGSSGQVHANACFLTSISAKRLLNCIMA